jgi:RNA polymerase sigma factor (sigma-70 family)
VTLSGSWSLSWTLGRRRREKADITPSGAGGTVPRPGMTGLSDPVAFIRLPDSELYRLDEDALVEYGRHAKDAGDLPAARTALALLVFGLERNIERRVAMRVPTHAVEEVSHEVIVRAVGAAFDGSSVGQFRRWLTTIIDRTVADHYRRRERRPSESPLPSEHAGDESVWGDEPAIEDEAAAVETQIIIDDVVATLAPNHREVIELHVFEGLRAPEVCDRIDGMTEANVAQIASRFRKQLRIELERGGDPA